MSAEAFFDSNVLLYMASGEAEKARQARTLLEAGGVISVQVLNEFANVCLVKFKKPLFEVRATLRGISEFCIVKPLDVATHERALDVAERYRFGIYDSLIVASALQAGCR